MTHMAVSKFLFQQWKMPHKLHLQLDVGVYVFFQIQEFASNAFDGFSGLG